MSEITTIDGTEVGAARRPADLLAWHLLGILAGSRSFPLVASSGPDAPCRSALRWLLRHRCQQRKPPAWDTRTIFFWPVIRTTLVLTGRA